MENTVSVNGTSHQVKPEYDALIIGAGFSGLRMIHECRQLGLSLKAFEAGPAVGGTCESWVYIMNFSKQLNDEWTWKERFPCQPEFHTRIQSARWNDDTHFWTLETEFGKKHTCKYFIPAGGVLSASRRLPFLGVERFKGEWYQSSYWPRHSVSLKGKRVAVVGNYVIPARNHLLSADQQESIKENYAEIWAEAKNQSFGMSMTDSHTPMSGLSEAKIQRVLEGGWEAGGFRFVFETFGDLISDRQSNDIASEFVRNKIRSVVKDEKTAEKLCPKYGLFAKRPPLGHYYFETFNRANVSLVDARTDPIKEVTEHGLCTESGEQYEFDTIIYAIGFDAGTGSLTSFDINGRNGENLGQKWASHVETYLGMAMTNFPNMFAIAAPQGPFANFPVVLDSQAPWVGKTISYMEKNNYKQVEPTQEAMAGWTKTVNDIYAMTILPEATKDSNSYFIGANVPGKKIEPLFWFGGIVPYFQACEEEVHTGFPNFVKS
ncbi:hypothetical protein M409DRAFT_66838 [Zasmidium cellare ATCC 36951]|uniref:FAD/NAD(P)-binding domain-containing protein n=1 Tax=Zasmidium cellare ATCC 36951 TaxID=1080233 RepID=A0A6A6CIR3_ZASCE|nr:uncharacterized protein M409DRAFT_66838 [Zasmidium cellare ATCC 36951]KAF2165852.1 hypothetical protein M409DRAFT_66838 [Zasmidium cellare ATCC 36951]